jgi:hypothetical protein
LVEDVMEIGRHCAALPRHCSTRVDPTRFSAMTRAVFDDDYRRNVVLRAESQTLFQLIRNRIIH